MDQQTARQITTYAEEYRICTFVGSVTLSGATHYYVQFIDDDLLFSTPIGAARFIEAIAEERHLVRHVRELPIDVAV